MISWRAKFEVSMITCNEDLKGNARCQNSRLEPPYGDLGVTHRVHLWLDEKCIVDFLVGLLRGTVVERRSLVGELSLCCARPVADR